jgi:hypothetical protein
MKKRTLSLITACVMVFSVLCIPVAAANISTEPNASAGAVEQTYLYNNYFSGGSGTLNTVAGAQSKIASVSSGGLSVNAKVTSVALSITISKGSTDFYVVITSPEGSRIQTYVAGSNTSTVTRNLTLNDFNNEYPKGTWNIYIYNTGTTYTEVATATINMTVNYGYDNYD